MNEEDFERIISQYAQINRKIKKRGKRGGGDPIEVQRGLRTIVIEGEDNNPTIGVVVEKILSNVRACEGCNRQVKDRKVEYKLHQTPKRHWRERCSTCGKTRDPETGKFSLTDPMAHRHFQIALKSPDLEPAEKKPAK